jgi:hypothetical protein
VTQRGRVRPVLLGQEHEGLSQGGFAGEPGRPLNPAFQVGTVAKLDLLRARPESGRHG